MAPAISLHMKGGRASSSGASQTQTHLHLCHYLTEGLWGAIMDKDNSWETKKGAMADFLMQIGLRHPSDPAVKDLLAILSHCHGRSLQPGEACDQLHKFKLNMSAKRLTTSGQMALLSYPLDPKDFMKQCQRARAEGDGPVKTRIEPMKIKHMTRKDLTPARSTNLAIGGRQRAAESSSPKVADRKERSDDLAELLLRKLKDDGGSPSGKRRYASKGPAVAACLAIADQQARGHCGAAAGKKALDNAKGKRKKKGGDSDEEKASDDEEVPLLGGKPAAAAPPRKRPSAAPACKRPSAAPSAAGSKKAKVSETTAELLRRLPKDFSKSFLKREVAMRISRGAFTARGYALFKKTDKVAAPAAYNVAARFWGQVHG
ncbi:unnamed protein product [Prorocentrum cordatum]|uniref:Uncharacterized protein n=1 Tax=Prorocentrum cordatum TaxID=2364126 RepID=A0ABN9R3H1_9DINO|nr:unnamed protein product [Polarella glacialis]